MEVQLYQVNMSPLRSLSKLEVKNYEWWSIFLTIIVLNRYSANVKIILLMEKQGMGCFCLCLSDHIN